MTTDRAQLLTILQKSSHLFDKTEMFLLVLVAEDQTTLQAYEYIRHYVMELRQNHRLIEEVLSCDTD